MGKPLVSIITPTYNHEKFIGRCIESVISQTYPYWEMIIVDDGSNDSTPNIIKRFNDERIKYIKQERKGIWRLSETYNRALQISRGDLIAILEGDDFWPDNKLEKQVVVFENPEVVLSWGEADIVDEFNEKTGYRPKTIGWLKTKSNLMMYKYLFFGNFIPACTVMCSKSKLVEIKGFKQCKEFPYVDHTTWLELGLKGQFYYLDFKLGYWRHHETQVSAKMSVEMVKSLIYGKYLLKKMTNKQRKELNLANVDLIKFNWAHTYYSLRYKLEENKESKKDSRTKTTKKSSFNITNVLIECYTILKINISWFVFLINN